MSAAATPRLLILNQMAGPMVWELGEDLGSTLGPVALLTGHPDTLAKGSRANVVLFPAAPYQRGGYPRRMLSWLLYLVQAALWLWRWPSQIPLLLFSNPPMLPWLGYLARRLRGQRYAVMVYDIYPEMLLRVGFLSERHPVVRLWRWLNRRAYERAGVVMTLGECMAANLARQFDPAQTPAGRVEVILPWADTDVIRPRPKEENWFARQHGQVGKLTLMYSGNMGVSHDIETMLAAARRLQDEGVPDVHFLFVGAGPKWRLVEDSIGRQDLANVTLLPWQPEDALPFAMATADVGLVSLDDVAHGLAVPSKACYLMAAGAALLALGRPPNDLQLMVERYQCGLNVEPGNADAVVQAILRLRADPSLLARYRRAARLAAERELSRQVNARRVREAIGLSAPARAIVEEPVGAST